MRIAIIARTPPRASRTPARPRRAGPSAVPGKAAGRTSGACLPGSGPGGWDCRCGSTSRQRRRPWRCGGRCRKPPRPAASNPMVQVVAPERLLIVDRRRPSDLGRSLDRAQRRLGRPQAAVFPARSHVERPRLRCGEAQAGRGRERDRGPSMHGEFLQRECPRATRYPGACARVDPQFGNGRLADGGASEETRYHGREPHAAKEPA